jgi:mono/diheme cytochrome c family protein
MTIKLSTMLLTLSLSIVLTACGNDKTAVSSTNPEPTAASSATAIPATALPTVEPTASPAATEAPQASIAATLNPTTAPTETPVTATATPKATPIATVKPSSTPAIKPTATPKASEPDNSAVAEALFKQSCTSCHGVDLGGDFGPNLQKVGAHLTKAQIINQITNGGSSMPSFKDGLKADEIQALATWLAAKK